MIDIMTLIDRYAQTRADAAALAGTRRANFGSERRREADEIREQIIKRLAVDMTPGEFFFNGTPATCLEYCPLDHMYLIEHEGSQNPDWIEDDDPRLRIVRG